MGVLHRSQCATPIEVGAETASVATESWSRVPLTTKFTVAPDGIRCPTTGKPMSTPAVESQSITMSPAS